MREWKDDIVLLRKVVPGRADRSYGIQVARLAGLPPCGRRARARDPRGARAGRAVARRPAVPERRAPRSRSSSWACSSAAAERHPVARRLRALDVDRLTPLDALNLLAELKREPSHDYLMAWRDYLRPRVRVMLALGFSSGLPFLLTGNDASATGCATKARA